MSTEVWFQRVSETTIVVLELRELRHYSILGS